MHHDGDVPNRSKPGCTDNPTPLGPYERRLYGHFRAPVQVFENQVKTAPSYMTHNLNYEPRGVAQNPGYATTAAGRVLKHDRTNSNDAKDASALLPLYRSHQSRCPEISRTVGTVRN